jgi:hypothetical protein
MDIKRKTFDIRTWKNHLFLNISSTNIDTRPIALPMHRNPQHRSLLNKPLPHFHLNLFVINETFATKAAISHSSYEQLCEVNTSHHKQETFLYDLCTETFCL